MANLHNPDIQTLLGGADKSLLFEARYGTQKVLTFQLRSNGVAYPIVAGSEFEVAPKLYTVDVTGPGNVDQYDPEAGVLDGWDVHQTVANNGLGIFQLVVPDMLGNAAIVSNPDIGLSLIPAALCWIHFREPSNISHNLPVTIIARPGSGIADPPIADYVAGRGINYIWDIGIDEVAPAPSGGTQIGLSNAPPPKVGLQGTETAGVVTDPHYGQALRGSAKAELDDDVTAVLADYEARIAALEAQQGGGGTPSGPTAHPFTLGLAAAVPPSATDFSVQGTGGLVVPDIGAGTRRYIVIARDESLGAFDQVYYYADGHRDDRNRLGTSFLAGAGTVEIGGVQHVWARSRTQLGSSASGRIVETIDL